MLEFRIGERVEFQPEGQPLVVGMLTRYNKKSVTVIADSGQRWTVAPRVLRRVPEQTGQTARKPDVIQNPHPRSGDGFSIKRLTEAPTRE